ncbi:MAG TPA: hypothetical protein VNA19_03395 [Pyrinomonadaceae bacterium]|nr:hypothetical protein [Pyrinomonadaceae bacterium]
MQYNTPGGHSGRGSKQMGDRAACRIGGRVSVARERFSAAGAEELSFSSVLERKMGYTICGRERS